MLDEQRFPALIRDLYRVVAELEKMFPGRPFTPDGHMVGSLGECFAAYHYGLELLPCSFQGHDAVLDGRMIQIKATQRRLVGLSSGPEHLLVLHLSKEGVFREVYNGPGAPVWALFEKRPRPGNGQYSVSVARLRKMMLSVPHSQRLHPSRLLPIGGVTVGT